MRHGLSQKVYSSMNGVRGRAIDHLHEDLDSLGRLPSRHLPLRILVPNDPERLHAEMRRVIYELNHT